MADRMGVSRHTVDVHVKTLYRERCVNTRAELLAKFVRPRACRVAGRTPVLIRQP